MPNVVWKLPVPATALLDEAALEVRSDREVALRMTYEADDNGDDVRQSIALVFEGVEAFSITYMTACAPSMLEAYAKLVDEGWTEWLDSVQKVLPRQGELRPTTIRHLMLMFDDGPCYEALCRSFRVDNISRTPVSPP